MDINKSDNRIQQNEELSKGKANQVNNSKSIKIKKVLLAIAVVTITTGAYAQTNDMNSNKSQDMKNKSTLDNDYNQNSDVYNHSDGYMIHNGRIMMIKNGKMTSVDKDVTLPNGTTITKDGTYLIKGGTKTKFKDGEHMDMSGKMIPMDKSNNYNKSETGKSSKKDSIYWVKDSIKNKKH